MKMNEYQQRAMETCLPSCDNWSYMMLNLVGEVGEFAGKVAKHIRKENLCIGGDFQYDNNHLREPSATRMSFDEYEEVYADLKSEAGDILWQLAGLCKIMDWDLNDVAQCNLDKLANRKKEGTIISHTDH